MKTESAAIKELISIFESMAAPSTRVSKGVLRAKIEKFERWLFRIYASITSAYIPLALVAKLGSYEQELYEWIYWGAILSLIFGVALILVSIFSTLIELRSARGRVHGAIFDRMRRDSLENWQSICQLRAYPRYLVEFAFSQFTSQWDAMGVRISLLAGDFLRLGLMPALAASASAAFALSKQHANVLFWVPVGLVALAYIMVFFALASRERVRHASDTIGHLVKNWDAYESTTVKRDSEASSITAGVFFGAPKTVATDISCGDVRVG